MKKLIVILLLVFILAVAIFGAMSVAGGNLSDEDTIWNAMRNGPGGDTELVLVAGDLDLTPGVFSGTGRGGFYGNVSVEITVEDTGIITQIEVTYSSETATFADPAFAHLTREILTVQHGDVDVFAGATYSSTAFLNAVQDALEQSIEAQ